MFIEEIALRLSEQGAGLPGTAIFLGRKAVLPVDDRAFLTVIETGGSGADRTQNGGAVARPTAQIVGWSKKYVDARAIAQIAYDALGGDLGLHNITLSEVFYLSITPRQSLTDIGSDQSGRVGIAFNIEAEKAPS